MNKANSLGVVVALGTVLGLGLGCEETSSSSSSASSSGGSGAFDNLAEQPTSMYGRSAAMGRNLKEQIEQRDAAAQGIADQLAGVESVEVGGLRWGVPEGWMVVEPSNAMRAAEMRVPSEFGECIVTFSQAGGTVQDNLTRWGRQMIDGAGDPTRPRAKVRRVSGLNVHVVGMYGTYMDGMPGRPQTERPYYAMRGAIVETPGALTFVKMWGPEDAMDPAMNAWDTMISGMTRP